MGSIPSLPTVPNHSEAEMRASSQNDGSLPPSSSTRNPYRGVICVLLLAALLGTASSVVGGLMIVNPVLLDVAVTLGLATGILIGVAVARTAWVRPTKRAEEISIPNPVPEPEKAVLSKDSPTWDAAKVSPRLTAARAWVSSRVRNLGALETIRASTIGAGVIGIIFLLLRPTLPGSAPPLLVAGIAAGLCLGAAVLAAMGARYFASIDADVLLEAPWLCRGARVIAWILVMGAISVGLEWAGLTTILQILHFAVMVVNAAICYGLFAVKLPKEGVVAFPLDLGDLLPGWAWSPLSMASKPSSDGEPCSWS